MQTHDFYFDLPPEQIAQSPAEPRDAAKLLLLDKNDGHIDDRVFSDLPDLLVPGDVLVVNNSRVLPARLIGRKTPSGGVCELLLLKQQKQDEWECLARPGKRLRPGAKLEFGDGSLTAEIKETLENGGKIVQFFYDTATLYEKLDAFGQMPLPPYITAQILDNNDYQTVYAKTTGSAAAPTAGLHFTPQLLEELAKKGIELAEITLHVGLGTFRPVQEENIEDHVMHSEWYTIDEQAAQTIQRAKQEGRRVIAVGTTSCRTLESVMQEHGRICAVSGDTDIFIYPGKQFNVIDGLITNFHLPESTLIMLVSAFCGQENTMNAYRYAVENNYRFFSFGDAMMIV